MSAKCSSDLRPCHKSNTFSWKILKINLVSQASLSWEVGDILKWMSRVSVEELDNVEGTKTQNRRARIRIVEGSRKQNQKVAGKISAVIKRWWREFSLCIADTVRHERNLVYLEIFSSVFGKNLQTVYFYMAQFWFFSPQGGGVQRWYRQASPNYLKIKISHHHHHHHHHHVPKIPLWYINAHFSLSLSFVFLLYNKVPWTILLLF